MAEGAGGRIKAATPIKEVLPKNGLVYSEKGAMSEMLCRPKILPIKSISELHIERVAWLHAGRHGHRQLLAIWRRHGHALALAHALWAAHREARHAEDYIAPAARV